MSFESYRIESPLFVVAAVRAAGTVVTILMCLLAGLAACVTPMRLSKETKKSFAVPDICDADLRIQDNVMACARQLMPIGRSYGAIALAKLDDNSVMIPADKRPRVMELKKTITEKCMDETHRAANFYDVGQDYDGTEIAAGALLTCFGSAHFVLDNFGAKAEGAALREAANRALWGLYIDDEFLIPPEDLYLGPKGR